MSDNYRLNYRGLVTYDTLLKRYFQNKLPDVMVGATRFSDGKSGLVPTPLSQNADYNNYLRGDGTWSTIPSFVTLYDHNDEIIKVEQEPVDIANIVGFIPKKVDLEGHLTLSLFATEDCNVFVKIRCDNVTEIYMPQELEVKQGYNSFGVSHAYLGRQPGEHEFTVSLQTTNGEITIPTRGILYTIYGAIDDTYDVSGIDIIDIAVKELSTIGTPSEIWSIGFEENNLLLRNNEYNNPNGNQWNEIYNFGTVRGGAIEFYGTWYEDRRQNKSKLFTEENPFVFIIDANSDLLVYTDGDYENSTLLATGVDKVSACTCYKSNIISSLDQGMVVAYLKNGNVYYRQWKYYDETSNNWFPAEEVDVEGGAIDVSVHRLPDYRVGILVKKNDGSKWYISDRTFIGNTFKLENLDTNTDSYTVIDMVPAERTSETLGVATINEFEEAHYHNGFIMTFEGDLHFVGWKTYDDLVSNISASRAGVSVPIRSVTIANNKLIVYTVNDVQGGANFTISWTISELVTTNVNGSNMLITQKSYTWSLPTTTIVEQFKDSIGTSLDGALNTFVRPVVRFTEVVPSENVSTSVDGSLNTIVHAINRFEEVVPNEIIETNVDGGMSISVILVGDVPV